MYLLIGFYISLNNTFSDVLYIIIYYTLYFSDNYGFVTFVYKNDAYAAIEHGNDDPSLPTYDLSFGGRRAFCKYKYSDLGKKKNTYAYMYTYIDVLLSLT